MTYREDFTLPAELLEQVHEQGLEILPELIQVILNTTIGQTNLSTRGVHPLLKSKDIRLHTLMFIQNHNSKYIGHLLSYYPS